MLLRAVRWGLAGVLVAWTLLRLLGLDLGWPLVPLLAFTPWVAALALVGAVAAALFGRRLFALLVGACALAADRRAGAAAWCRTARRPTPRACGCGCWRRTSPATSAPRAGDRRARAAAAGRRAGRRGADARGRGAYDAAGHREAAALPLAEPAAGLLRLRALRAAAAARGAGARRHALRALRRRGEPARGGALRGARHPRAGADLARRRRRLAPRPAQAAERAARAGCGSWPATSTPRSTTPSSGA